MNISFEIVPRTAQAFAEQYHFASSLGQSISMINVPDIQRFTMRSWELATKINRNIHQFIPHFRATDFSLQSGDIFRIIEENQLNHVLIVSGDPPDGIRQVHNTSALALIAAVRKRFSHITIHAGFDPHRSGLQDECDYVFRKVDAGANSFFSQPFYDTRLIEIYAEHLRELVIYIGLSPIVTGSAKNYWEVKNKVKFPVAFKAEYGWNIDFSNQVMQIARKMNFNIYFMPIKINLADFFGNIDFK